ncbi:nuclear transport factor 2 family protein [Roseococcus sp. SYP-B2431]|uniref:nuclear transport factor 2 family protein n=1 Tax=Roseococcus sp. SYP-B2431 TaxID=2496640 RepID=UPI001F102CE5|nr:nuclear transport factor 2 family protein [Roseococcus sp. SYP-B2431]
MTDAAGIAESYIALWNETDAGRRKALLAQGWTEGATYIDPLMKGQGHAEIDALVGAVQARFPGFRFGLVRPADGHGDFVRFSWGLSPGGLGPDHPIQGSDVLSSRAGGSAR